ncbi:MAG: glycosyltransferase family 39 protein [Candidatus Omnitrophica bacterium]|nr:glycosyltransferase family 39 protein [Candidatus Omnitrophota bacterium]
MLLLKFVLAVLSIIITGYAGLRLFTGPKKELPLGEILCLAFGMGVGFVGLEAFFLTLFKQPLGLNYFLSFQAAFIIFVALKVKKSFFCCCFASWHKQKISYSPLAVLLLTIIAWEIVYVFLKASSLPFSALNWDAWASWGFKAKIFFQERAFPVQFCVGFPGFAHPGYPVLMPFAETYVYLFLGQIHEPLVKLFCSFFYAAIIILFYYQLKRQFEVEFALSGCLVLATIPNLVNMASTAYMDVPLAFYITAGVLYIWRYLKEKDDFYLKLGTFFIGLGMWVKNEGFSFWVALILSCLFICLLFNPGINKKKFLSAVVFLPALIYLPWVLFKVYFKLGVTYFQGPVRNLPDLIKQRLPLAAEIWIRYGLDIGRWNIFWVGFIIALLWFFVRPREKLAWFLLLIVIFQLVFYFIIYMIWPISLPDLELQIFNSAGRLPLQLVTVVLFFICLQAGEKWKNAP